MVAVMRARGRISTLYALLILVACVWLVPVIFVVFTALKTPEQLAAPNGLFAIPQPFDWANLASAWTIGNIGQYMKNSVIVTTIKVPAGIVLTILPVIAVYLVFQRYFVSGLAGAIKG